MFFKNLFTLNTFESNYCALLQVEQLNSNNDASSYPEDVECIGDKIYVDEDFYTLLKYFDCEVLVENNYKLIIWEPKANDIYIFPCHMEENRFDDELPDETIIYGNEIQVVSSLQISTLLQESCLMLITNEQNSVKQKEEWCEKVKTCFPENYSQAMQESIDPKDINSFFLLLITKLLPLYPLTLNECLMTSLHHSVPAKLLYPLLMQPYVK